MRFPNGRNLLSIATVFCAGLATAGAVAQEQDAESKALDSTATQWSYQFAYQTMPDYKGGTLDNGQPRPAGADNYWQLRVVAPLVYDSFTILPRVTLRHYENPNGDNGWGNTEIFGLFIPKSWDWGTGRTGFGPLVTLPGNDKVARDEWGYGLAGAIVNTSGNWFYGMLLTQSWRAIDPNNLPPPGNDVNDANPLGIAPFLNYRLGDGWYVGNGDMVIQYDWNSGNVNFPIGVRVGKVLQREKGSWNIYGEYQTSLVYQDWPGAAVDTSIRLNVTYTVPVGN